QDSNYIEVVSDCVREEMLRQMEADEKVYYWVNDEITGLNFEYITEDNNFYIDENYDLVMVFDKYEVAPGYMGLVEIKIPKESIKDIVVEKYFQ
ncbi:MAG: RsiV family protein, partial [Eubacteriales bacterium]|nr:RsiV family protein [Eubacteriales bacterium]